MTPIRLEGHNLGERHRHLNLLVNDAFKNRVPFDSIRDLKEHSDVDRFFKIDLANKYKRVDYIIQNLQSDDMLYVSRALQSEWLITDEAYENVVNPTYLHDQLYPKMFVPAVHKMSNRIENVLKDEKRCQLFYEFYKQKQLLADAHKYLPKCSATFILDEMKNIDLNPSPRLLKLLCEKNPNVADYYFNHMIYNGISNVSFINNQEEYLLSTKYLMKTHSKLYFDILEKFHLVNFKMLSKEATHFVMRTQIDRFRAKPELYARCFLNLTVVANYLGNDEIKDLIIKLARAEYLSEWFSYKSMEPLLKRLNKDGKSDFVKYIFVHKSFGPMIKESAYEFPQAPDLISKQEEPNIHFPFLLFLRRKITKRLITKRRVIKAGSIRIQVMDDVYDRYRFANFPKTFFELRKRIQTESNHSNRRIMLTVLITKSKNNENYIKNLLEYFISKHLNEPITLKCSFARTIVSQTNAYKYNNENWSMLELIFHNIGVFDECEGDVTKCIEAIIVHSVLNDQEIPDVIINKYFNVFKTLYDYNLTELEGAKVFDFISTLLVAKIESSLKEDSNLHVAIDFTWKFLNLIDDWKKPLIIFDNILQFIKIIVEMDSVSSKSLLLHIYKKKTCRKLFFGENFAVKQDQESYFNVLKHDFQLLANSLEVFENLINSDSFRHERFICKIKTYFCHDLAESYLKILKINIENIQNKESGKNIARCLCILNGSMAYDFFIWKIPRKVKLTGKDKKVFFQLILLRNAFLVRPPIPINMLLSLQEAAIVPLTTLLLRSSSQLCAQHMAQLAAGPQPFVKLAVRLAFKKLDNEQMLMLCKYIWQTKKINRVQLTLLTELLKLICNPSSVLQLELMEFLQHVIRNLKPQQIPQIYELISNIDRIPDCIKADYCVTAYEFLSNAHYHIGSGPNFSYTLSNGTTLFSNISWPEILLEIINYINKNFHKFKSQFIFVILNEFLQNTFLPQVNNASFTTSHFDHTMYILVPHYLVASNTKHEQDERFETLGKVIMTAVRTLWCHNEDYARKIFHSFIMYLNMTMNVKWIDMTPVFHTIIEEFEDILLSEKHFSLMVQTRMSLAHANALKSVVNDIDPEGHRRDMEVPISKLAHNVGMFVGLELDKICIEYNISVAALIDVYLTQYFRNQFLYYLVNNDSILSIAEGLISNKSITNSIIAGIEYININKDRFLHRKFPQIDSILMQIRSLNNLELNVVLNARISDITVRYMTVNDDDQL